VNLIISIAVCAQKKRLLVTRERVLKQTGNKRYTCERNVLYVIIKAQFKMKAFECNWRRTV